MAEREQAASVSDYQVFFAKATWPGGAPQIVIREFRQSGRDYRLLVDPQTLSTQIVPATALKIEPNTAFLTCAASA